MSDSKLPNIYVSEQEVVDPKATSNLWSITPGGDLEHFEPLALYIPAARIRELVEESMTFTTGGAEWFRGAIIDLIIEEPKA